MLLKWKSNVQRYQNLKIPCNVQSFSQNDCMDWLIFNFVLINECKTSAVQIEIKSVISLKCVWRQITSCRVNMQLLDSTTLPWLLIVSYWINKVKFTVSTSLSNNGYKKKQYKNNNCAQFTQAWYSSLYMFHTHQLYCLVSQPQSNKHKQHVGLASCFQHMFLYVYYLIYSSPVVPDCENKA